MNGRKGRQQAEVALQNGAEIEADVVVIAEALEDQQRRPGHGLYDLVWNSKYISITQERTGIRVVGKGGGQWALIGGNKAAAWLKPQLNHRDAGENGSHRHTNGRLQLLWRKQKANARRSHTRRGTTRHWQGVAHTCVGQS